jgi:hypothetical protein
MFDFAEFGDVQSHRNKGVQQARSMALLEAPPPNSPALNISLFVLNYEEIVPDPVCFPAVTMPSFGREQC